MKALSASEKAAHTAKWARIMSKWLVTYTRRRGARWTVVDFCGKTGAEARGIVDLMAIRKDHRTAGVGLKRGDLFEIILIQTKGGAARRPSAVDMARLSRVAEQHRAKAVVLATWRRGEVLEIQKLDGSEWHKVSAADVFG